MSSEASRRKSANWPLRIALVLSALYVYSAFLPFEFRPDWWRPDIIRYLLWREPFHDRPHATFGFYFSISNAIVNFAAGLLLGWHAAIGWRRAVRWSIIALVLAILQGGITAAAMEVVQVGVVGRVPTPTDIVTISAGAGSGAMFALLLGRLLWERVWEPLVNSLLRSPAGLAFTLIALYLAVHCLFPTSVSAVYGEVLRNAAKANITPLEMPGPHLAVQLRRLGFDIDDRPYRNVVFWSELTPRRYAFQLAGYAFLYLALSTALAAWRGGGLIGDWLICFPIVTFLGGLIEGLQVFLPSRCADINVVLIAAATGLAGPVVWRLIRVHRVVVTVAVVLAAVGYASTQLLSPGQPSWGHVGFWNFVPIRGMERSSHRIELLLNVFEWFAMMVPVGWAVAAGRLAAGNRSVSAVVIGAIVAFIVALVLESLQAFVGRIPSIDSVVLGAVGGACGTWIAVRQHRAVAESYH